MQTKRICLWSGPRNVSTALMYAFAQRSDTQVVDEPLYAHYLHTKYGANAAESAHPGSAEVLASLSTDATTVVRDVILGPCDTPVLFMKQMAHHLIEIDLSFLQRTLNVFLIRDPKEMLPSLTRVIGVPDPRRHRPQDAARPAHRFACRRTGATDFRCAAPFGGSTQCFAPAL